MNPDALQAGRKPLKERSRRPEEALPHSVNHWIRVEALSIFHEGEASVGEVADMIGEDVRVVRNHVIDLYNSGCIEFVGYKMVGNNRKPVYSAIALPVISDEAARKMSIEERRDVSAAVLQGFQAECLSSYRNGKMDDGEDVCLIWDAPDLDAEGREELQEHLTASWEETLNIHARSANRMATSGEAGATTVVGLLSFKRGRPGRPESGYFKRK